MDTTKAANSAATTENQMPKTPKNAGRIKIAAISNKKVRKKEISAETKPLLNAVKNEDAHVLMPLNKYAML